MGVRGLSTHLERSEEVGQDVDLSAEAAARPEGAVRLVIDLSNIAYRLIERAAEDAVREAEGCDAPAPGPDADGAGATPAHAASGRERGASSSTAFLVSLCGGEYDALDACVASYFGSLRRAGVLAHCYLDPAKGSDEDEERKYATWAKRMMEDRLGAMELQKWCSTGRGLPFAGVGGAAAGAGAPRHVPVPPLAFRQIMVTLQRMEVPVSICVGEADQHLLHEMRRLGAFAVVSDDSDFAVLAGSRWIPARTLVVPPAAGRPVRARLITPEHVAASLSLPRASLSELAALVGNDLTGPLAADLDVLRAVGVTAAWGRPKVTDAAAWMRRLPDKLASNSPALRDLLEKHGELRDAWERSARFYECDPPALPADARLAALDAGVAAMSLPPYAIAVARHGRYWCSTRAECVQCGRSPLAEELLAPHRAVLYGMLGRDVVEERFVAPGQWELTRRIVIAAPPPLPDLPDLLSARSAPEERRQAAFAALLGVGPLPAGPLGPAALLLRFYLSLVSSRGLDLSASEWRAILLTTAASSLGPGPVLDAARRDTLARFTRGNVRPTFRSVAAACKWQAAVASCLGYAQALDVRLDLEPRALFSGLAFQRFLDDPTDPGPEIAGAAAELLALVAEGLPDPEPALRRFLDPSLDLEGQEDAGLPLHEDCWEAVEALWDEEGDSDEDVEAMLAAAQEPVRAPAFEAGGVPGAAPSPERLPIDEHREAILAHIAAHRVTCIQGETGSGKSSKLPVFLLEEAQREGRKIRVIITQPRRIAAISLARRVAQMVGCKLGDAVGYCVSRDKKTSSSTQVVYATVGYVLQLLSHKPDETGRFTHVFLDEVHERGVDHDLLSLLFKLLLRDRPQVKLVVMSATLHAELFSRYFAGLTGDGVPPAPIFVGAARYPLEYLYLEHLPAKFPASTTMAASAKAVLAHFKDTGKDKSGKLKKGATIKREAYVLCVELLSLVLAPSKTVLVFLPGVAEMTALQLDVQARIPGACDGSIVEVVLLHSTISREEQEAAFMPLPVGKARLIIATNIAESSITLPNVHYVVDFGMHRQVVLDKKKGVQGLSLAWCSRASCIQRAGRAGRLFPGTVVRVMTKQFHDTALPDFDTAEMLRISLEHAILRVKLLFSHFGTVKELMKEAVESPTDAEIEYALWELYQTGAITDAEQDADVTLFGQLAAVMPVSLSVSKLVLYGLLFHCECDAVCMAAAMTVQDPFSLPMLKYKSDVHKYCADLARSFRSRISYDEGEYSELISCRNLWIDWTLAKRRRDFAYNNSVSFERMKAFDATVADIATHFVGFLTRNGVDVDRLPGLIAMSQRWKEDSDLEWLSGTFTNNMPLLKAVVALSTRPGLFMRANLAQPERKKFKELRETMAKHALDPARTLHITLGRSGKSVEVSAKQLGKILRELVDVNPEKIVEDTKGGLAFYVMLRPDEHSEEDDRTPTLQDLPSDGKLLRYLTGVLAYGAKLAVPLRRGASSEAPDPDEPTIVFESILQLGAFNWIAVKPPCIARVQRRSPLASASHFESMEDVWAVTADAMLMSEALNVSGTTVLPRSRCFGPIMLLAMGATEWDEADDAARPVRLYVDTALTRIHSASLPGTSTAFSFHPRSPPLQPTLRALNRLRECLSAAYAPGIWPRSSEVKTALADLFACVPSEPVELLKETKYKWVLLPTEEDGPGERHYEFLPPYAQPIAETDMRRFASGEDAAMLAARVHSWSADPGPCKQEEAASALDDEMFESEPTLRKCAERQLERLHETMRKVTEELETHMGDPAISTSGCSACVWSVSEHERRVASCKEAPLLPHAIVAALSEAEEFFRRMLPTPVSGPVDAVPGSVPLLQFEKGSEPADAAAAASTSASSPVPGVCPMPGKSTRKAWNVLLQACDERAVPPPSVSFSFEDCAVQVALGGKIFSAPLPTDLVQKALAVAFERARSHLTGEPSSAELEHRGLPPPSPQVATTVEPARAPSIRLPEGVPVSSEGLPEPAIASELGIMKEDFRAAIPSSKPKPAPTAAGTSKAATASKAAATSAPAGPACPLPASLRAILEVESMVLWNQLASACAQRGMRPLCASEEQKARKSVSVFRMRVATVPLSGMAPAWRSVVEVLAKTATNRAHKQAAFDSAVKQMLGALQRMPQDSVVGDDSARIALCHAALLEGEPARMWAVLKTECARRGLPEPTWTTVNPDVKAEKMVSGTFASLEAFAQVQICDAEGEALLSFAASKGSTEAAAQSVFQNAVNTLKRLPAVVGPMTLPVEEARPGPLLARTSAESTSTEGGPSSPPVNGAASVSQPAASSPSHPAAALGSVGFSALPDELREDLSDGSEALWGELARECALRGLVLLPPRFSGDHWQRLKKAEVRGIVSTEMLITVAYTPPDSSSPAWRNTAGIRRGTGVGPQDNLADAMRRTAVSDRQAVFNATVRQALATVKRVPPEHLVAGVAEKIAKCHAASLGDMATRKWAELKMACARRDFPEPTWTTVDPNAKEERTAREGYARVRVCGPAGEEVVCIEVPTELTTNSAAEVGFRKATKALAKGKDVQSPPATKGTGAASVSSAGYPLAAHLRAAISDESAALWDELIHECSLRGLKMSRLLDKQVANKRKVFMKMRVNISYVPPGDPSAMPTWRHAVEADSVRAATATAATMKADTRAAFEAVVQPALATVRRMPLDSEAVDPLEKTAACHTASLDEKAAETWIKLKAECARRGLPEPTWTSIDPNQAMYKSRKNKNSPSEQTAIPHRAHAKVLVKDSKGEVLASVAVNKGSTCDSAQSAFKEAIAVLHQGKGKGEGTGKGPATESSSDGSDGSDGSGDERPAHDELARACPAGAANVNTAPGPSTPAAVDQPTKSPTAPAVSAPTLAGELRITKEEFWAAVPIAGSSSKPPVAAAGTSTAATGASSRSPPAEASITAPSSSAAGANAGACSLPADLRAIVTEGSMALWKELVRECARRGLQPPSVFEEKKAKRRGTTLSSRILVAFVPPGNPISMPAWLNVKDVTCKRIAATTNAAMRGYRQEAFDSAVRQALLTVKHVPLDSEVAGLAEKLAACQAASLDASAARKWAELKTACAARGLREPTWTSIKASWAATRERAWKGYAKVDLRSAEGAALFSSRSTKGSTHAAAESACKKAMKELAKLQFGADGQPLAPSGAKVDSGSGSDSSSDEEGPAKPSRPAASPSASALAAPAGIAVQRLSGAAAGPVFALGESSARAWAQLNEAAALAGAGVVAARVRESVADTGGISVLAEVTAGPLSKSAITAGEPSDFPDLANVALGFAAQSLQRELQAKALFRPPSPPPSTPQPAAGPSSGTPPQQPGGAREAPAGSEQPPAAGPSSGLAAAAVDPGAFDAALAEQWHALLEKVARIGVPPPAFGAPAAFVRPPKPAAKGAPPLADDLLRVRVPLVVSGVRFAGAERALEYAGEGRDLLDAARARRGPRPPWALSAAAARGGRRVR